MIGLYVHIPFCAQKCNYCDFCSYPSLIQRQSEYCDALAREVMLYKSYGLGADTVYFGGGTPSLLESSSIAKVMDAIHECFNVSPDAEITIEANPCTVTAQKAADYRALGFNRVSLGAQSFIDSELSALGRLHSSDDTVRSYDILRNAGFSNISLDLMYAIPTQDFASLSTSITKVLNLAPEHISCYGLKIEDGTPFGRMLESGIISEKTDDEYADMYEQICTSLTLAGYGQYELSNFSRTGFESKHNLKYWQGKEYIGLGASAASFYGGCRYTRTSDFDGYITSFANAEHYELSKDELMSEFMFLQLRLTELGASKAEFHARFGKHIDEAFAKPLAKHLAAGTLVDKGDRYVLSQRAYYVSNSVLCDFV